jgi:hypothetical protein
MMNSKNQLDNQLLGNLKQLQRRQHHHNMPILYRS